MSTPLDRIRKLVALASSANEHEARNAAVQACKLMTLHKVVLTMPEPVRAHVPYTPPPVRNVRTAGGANAPTADEVMRTGTPVDMGNVADAVFGREVGDAIRSISGEVFTMSAPQDGTCRDCGHDFFRGDRIWYRRGVGAVHTMSCDPDVLRQKRPAR